MGLTLAYSSALHAMRLLRSEQVDVKVLDRVSIARPVPHMGKRWGMREFTPDSWRWQKVSIRTPLHIMVARQEDRVWMKGVKCHVCVRDLPAGSIVWLDDRAAMVSPPLLFLQMARYLTFPALVMLGYELCGHYARCADDPIDGPVTDGLPMATSVEEISTYLRSGGNAWQVAKARRAIEYVQDNAVSAMEGLLATMYSLPIEELGYGMGPVTLNPRVRLEDEEGARSRYPDIMFSFAPVGINYDGEDHLDLDGLLKRAFAFTRAEGDDKKQARLDLANKRDEVRAKVVDDAARNRQLASRGRIVFPAMKEDLYGRGSLDSFTLDILHCAQAIFDVDITTYEKALDSTTLCNDRYELIASMLPFGPTRTGKRELL